MAADPIHTTFGNGETTGEVGRQEEVYLTVAEAHKYASFSHVADAHFRKSDREQGLLVAFERRHGKVGQIHYWENARAAVVCTEKHQIFVYCHAAHELADPEIESLICECQMLHYEARRLLKDGLDLQSCSELSYSLIFHLLGLLDASSENEGHEMTGDEKKARKSVLTFVRKEIGHARKYFYQSVQRQAQFHYFIGMIWGVLLIAGVVLASGVVAVETKLVSLPNLSAQLIAASNGAFIGAAGTFIAGALGAVISVMSRLSSGKCTLEYKAGRRMLRLIGLFRPLIGAVFGVASFMLLQAGLLSLAAPTKSGDGASLSYPPKALFLFWGLAFLAGFSERWARDMLNIAGRSATGDAAVDSVAGTANGTGSVITPRAPKRATRRQTLGTH